MTSRKIHQLSLEEFCSCPLGVIRDEDITPSQKRMVVQTQMDCVRLARMDAGGKLPETFFEVEAPGRPPQERWLFRKKPRACDSALVILGADNELLGGCFGATPWVDPAHRGKGLGAAMHLVSEAAGVRIFYAFGLSEAGHRARCSAHRQAVLAAVLEGLEVPQGNLDLYAVELERERRVHKEIEP